MADVAAVKADIKQRLMSEDWRKTHLTIAVAKATIDALDISDGAFMTEGFRRRLDKEVGRFLREKVEARLESIAETQVNAAVADGCLNLDEYEKLI